MYCCIGNEKSLTLPLSLPHAITLPEKEIDPIISPTIIVNNIPVILPAPPVKTIPARAIGFISDNWCERC